MKTVHEGMVEQRFFPVSKLTDIIEIQPGELICVKYAKYNVLFQNAYKTIFRTQYEVVGYSGYFRICRNTQTMRI